MTASPELRALVEASHQADYARLDAENRRLSYRTGTFKAQLAENAELARRRLEAAILKQDGDLNDDWISELILRDTTDSDDQPGSPVAAAGSDNAGASPSSNVAGATPAGQPVESSSAIGSEEGSGVEGPA